MNIHGSIADVSNLHVYDCLIQLAYSPYRWGMQMTCCSLYLLYYIYTYSADSPGPLRSVLTLESFADVSLCTYILLSMTYCPLSWSGGIIKGYIRNL